MLKNYFFFVDDNIRVFRDLTKGQTKSIFDNDYLRLYKDLHKKYGMKLQLNIFYETDDFNLSQMTERYRDEWKDNSDWLKLAFHANQEFPDYPYVNISYNQMKFECDRVQNEIIRFAGEQSLSYNVICHWLPVSLDGCMALKDLGVKTLAASWGNEETTDEKISLLSSKHYERLFQNRTEDTSWIYFKHLSDDTDILSLKGYNHLPQNIAKKYLGTNHFHKDDKTGLYFKRYSHIVLDRHEPKIILEILSEKLSYDYIGIGTHEQYFYEDYYNYRPDFKERVETAIKLVTNNGYKSVFLDELFYSTDIE